jgi:hypothetical protein
VQIECLRRALGRNGAPQIEAVATKGIGVFDTLKATINTVVAKVQMPG